jgi:hypothetical protein
VGSKLGWIIAGIFALLFAAVVTWLVAFPSPSDPTSSTYRPGILDFHAPQTPMDEFYGPPPAGAQNAAEHYAAGVEKTRQDEEDFDQMYETLSSTASRLSPREVDRCTSVYELIKPAQGKSEMAYTLNYTPGTFKVSAFAAGTDELLMLARVLECLGEHYRRAEESDKAIEMERARFLLGWHMMRERVRAQMIIAGMELQQAACYQLANLYQKTDQPTKAQAAERYARDVSSLMSLFQDKMRIIWTLKTRPDGGQGPEPGDVFRIIEHDKDRTWRVEGLLALGVLKLTEKGHRGNRRTIENLFEEYSASDDPYLRTAATAARDRSREQIEQDALGQ